MTETAPQELEPAGLYVSDKEIIRRLGFGEKTGYRILRRLDRGVRTFRPYPQKDHEFAGRRFWPAVLQWHMDYHRVRTGAETSVVYAPRWQENFNEPARKTASARQARHARSELAPA